MLRKKLCNREAKYGDKTGVLGRDCTYRNLNKIEEKSVKKYEYFIVSISGSFSGFTYDKSLQTI